MIRQSLADAGTVDQWHEADATEPIGGTDSGELQQLRGAECARTHHDLLVRERLVDATVPPVFDAYRTAVADEHALDECLGDDGQVVALVQVAPHDVPPLPRMDVDGGDRGAVEVGTRDVVVGRDARRPRRRDETPRQLVRVRRPADAHGTALDPLEHRRHVGPAPPRQLPAVVVERATLDPEHGVHGAAAAEHAAAGLRDHAVAAPRLRLGLVCPIQRGAVLEGPRQGSPDGEAPVGTPGFDQQHTRIGPCRQSPRNRTTR